MAPSDTSDLFFWNHYFLFNQYIAGEMVSFLGVKRCIAEKYSTAPQPDFIITIILTLHYFRLLLGLWSMVPTVCDERVWFV